MKTTGPLTDMKIALASQNLRSLTAHAGKCRHFFIVDSVRPTEAVSVNLAPSELLHNWSGNGPHPLVGVDTLIAATVGTGVAVKLARRGMRVLATSERDLARVVERLADNSLPVEPIRSEADARSTPGSCLLQTPASHTRSAILGSGPWGGKSKQKG